jgi:xanthine/CO dehydrogenase XdhC/CoxF family maturation factor
MFDIAATATSTNRDLPDHKALRSERTISIFVHGVRLENRLIELAIQVVHFKRFW